MSNLVRTVRANHGETVEIQWRCEDGAAYVERHTIPPASTREARAKVADGTATLAEAFLAQPLGEQLARARNAAGQVTDRLQANEAGQKYALPPAADNFPKVE